MLFSSFLNWFLYFATCRSSFRSVFVSCALLAVSWWLLSSLASLSLPLPLPLPLLITFSVVVVVVVSEFLFTTSNKYR